MVGWPHFLDTVWDVKKKSGQQTLLYTKPGPHVSSEVLLVSLVCLGPACSPTMADNAKAGGMAKFWWCYCKPS